MAPRVARWGRSDDDEDPGSSINAGAVDPNWDLKLAPVGCLVGCLVGCACCDGVGSIDRGQSVRATGNKQ
jgi:hypothetical protein